MDAVLTLPRGRPLTEDDLRSSPWTSARYEVIDGSLVVSSVGAPFAREDLDRLPDDGWRHELIEGALVMTPSPSAPHQRAVYRLWSVLDAACPPALEALGAPFDVALSGGGVTQVFVPDVVVARRADVRHQDLPRPPLLVVEVLSSSTRHIDLGRKFRRFQTAGVQSYWVIDPVQPHLTAWELRAGAYVEVADVADEWTATLPFPVTITLAELVG